MSWAGLAVHQGEALGRPSRAAATVALQAHLEVLKGEPLRLSLSTALKEQSKLGGQERRFAALATRELSRHQRVLDQAAKALGHAPSGWALKEDQALIRYVLWRRLFTGAPAQKILVEVKLPGPLRPRSVKDEVLEQIAGAPLPEPELPADPVERAAARHSFPNWLAARLAEGLEPERVDGVLAALNTEPSLVLRTRPPGARDEVLAALDGEGVKAEPLGLLPDAIRVVDAGNKIFETRAMKGGQLQVMDLGSQLIAALCRPETGFEGAHIADVCAGAGGKSLALADAVGERGKVFAGDASKRRLKDARERAFALRLRNVLFPPELPLGGVDVALVDAPCSGTGTLAREPDQKWKLTRKGVEELTATQGEILEQTAAGLREGAVLVYATCSLLREEDEAVVERFLAAHPEFELQEAAAVLPASARAAIVGPYLRAWPDEVPGGGFFGARLRKKAGR